jgi:predicted HNH restriction endonuclease
MKKCYKCQEIKELDQFYKNRSTKDGLSGYCKRCSHEGEKENNQLSKEWLQTLKNKCQICGESRWWVLDFHHVDPSKKTISIAKYAVSGTASFESKKKKILKELKSCIVICANCHRDIHYQEQTGAYQLNKRTYKNKDL